MELQNFVPALRKQKPGEVTNPYGLEEGQSVDQRVINRSLRLARRSEKARRRKGQRAYNRSLRQERIRRNTVQAQILVLQGPDSAMKRNVLAALERKYKDAENAKDVPGEVIGYTTPEA